MDALKAIVYRPKHTKPQIIFTSPRIDANDLYLSESKYKELKRRAQERLEAMRQYVLSDKECRSRMLLSYFGEDNVEPCGICDYCIQAKKESKRAKECNEALRTRLLELIKEHSYRAEELVAKVGHIYEKPVLQTLHELVDERLVTIDELLRFRIM